VEGSHEFASELLCQPLPASLSTLLVREHAARDTVQPHQSLLASRDLIQAAPGHEKLLCHDVGRILLIGRAADRVCEHRTAVLRVKAFKALLALSSVVGVPP